MQRGILHVPAWQLLTEKNEVVFTQLPGLSAEYAP